MNKKFTSGAKQFKDPVYGYIALPSAYANFLIDTQKLQRIKGVAQTGIRSVFAAASHDRFCHSLGVYKFGDDIFSNLQFRLKELIESLKDDPRYKAYINQEFEKSLEGDLERWKVLLHIACLLHDIGHPVQSHGFEFLYDDFYLDCSGDSRPLLLQDNIPSTEIDRVAKKHQAYCKAVSSGKGISRGDLSKQILDTIKTIDVGYRTDPNDPSVFGLDYTNTVLPGNPHERMSVLYIWTDIGLRENVKLLIENRHRKYSNDIDFFKDLLFISRMIIGWEYDSELMSSFKHDNFMNSIRNCIIHILNGIIDADGMDYLMRNAYSAGYDTSKVDYDRLCGACSVYEEGYQIHFAFSKSALSALEGYISARHFEPKWLYSHHKVVYSDLLMKQMYKYAVKYLAEKTMLSSSAKLFLENIKSSSFYYKPSAMPESIMLAKGDDAHLSARGLNAHMQQWVYPFYTYVLAPLRPVKIGERYFHHIVDADFDALLHSMQDELQEEGYDSYQQSLISIMEKHIPALKLEPDALRVLIAETYIHNNTMIYDQILSKSELNNKVQAWVKTGDKSSLNELKEFLNEFLNEFSVEWTAFNSDRGKDEIVREWISSYCTIFSVYEYDDFIKLLKEHKTRKYKASLWKSFAEYRLFIQDCARETGFSYDRVHDYMKKLITTGMDQKGFSIFDGRSSIKPPKSYEEQFYYIPYKLKRGESLFVSPTQIFSEHEKYDFSLGKVVVKFYRMKFKAFEKLKLMFRERVVGIKDVLDLPNPESVEYPYFFYEQDGTNNNREDVLNSFRKDFVNWCKEMHNNSTLSTTSTAEKYQFRDSVHGDIVLSEKYYEIVCTKEFQRLRRIKQLATAERAFPSATHTRFAHSLGTWFVMKQILSHLEKQFEEVPDKMRPTPQEKEALLLAALLHDLGHGPYSHAFEEHTGKKWSHEKQTIYILMDTNSSIHNKIKNSFGSSTLQLVVELLSGENLSDDSSMTKVIYHNLLSSQLDADRIDYVMRDNVACGMAYGHIDMQQIIASMRLTVLYSDGSPSFRLCFDDRYLPAIDQFIYARYQMYKNVYHEPRKLLYERVFSTVFKKARSLHELLIRSDIIRIICSMSDGEMIPTEEFLKLDDEAVNAQIRNWASGTILIEGEKGDEARRIAEQIRLLSLAFLGYEDVFEQIDLGEKMLPYEQLAKKLSSELMMDRSSMMHISDESCAVFYIETDSYAYSKEDPDQKGIFIRRHTDGILNNYFDCSMFTSAIGEKQQKLWESRCRCLFFSKKLMRQYCQKISRDSGDDLYKKILMAIEKARPRTHIEIEKKYLCAADTILLADDYLKKFKPKKIEEFSASEDERKDQKHDQERYVIESDQTKKQNDIYYDIISDGRLLLYSNGLSFRVRSKKDGSFIFTVKGAVKSKNYSSNQQTARYEYEMTSTTSDVESPDKIEFLLDSLAACGVEIPELSTEHLAVQEILSVVNERRTIRVKDIVSGADACEFCLDDVQYYNGSKEQIDKLYQIEIELLERPEYWYTLSSQLITPFETAMKEKGADIKVTKDSKLDIGINRLGLLSD